jgi:hypothetical protein
VKSWKNKLYSVVNLKENVEIVGNFQCKNRSSHNGGNNGNRTGTNFCLYCRKLVHDKKSCFKFKKKEARNGHASNFNGNADQRNYEQQDVVFTATSKIKILTDDIWICDSGACGYLIKVYLCEGHE